MEMYDADWDMMAIRVQLPYVSPACFRDSQEAIIRSDAFGLECFDEAEADQWEQIEKTEDAAEQAALINVATLDDAGTAYSNSGWLDRLLLGDDTDAVGRFIRQHCTADYIGADELNALIERYAVEVEGWDASEL